MAKYRQQELTPIEQQAVEKIQAVRKNRDDALHGLLQQPEHAMRHLIQLFHGNVKLRLAVIAHELGMEMRTLERAFQDQFGTSMQELQIGTRLKVAQQMLSLMPPLKLSVIANLLGYDEVRDFARFFQKQTHERPSAWGRAKREQITQAERLSSGLRKSV